MTTASMTFVPQAASLKRVAGRRLRSILQAIWAALETVGQRRAAAHLHQAASMYDISRPEFARELRRLAAAARTR
ncbi:MAG TPA: hypothetical protein VLA16_04225 [Ideonella sp.]|nr:hypothetical protein [Ideonella sp.]